MMGRATYLLWIVGCGGPIVLLHWAVGWRAIRARLRAVLGAAAIATAYLALVDAWAIRAGVWVFSPDLTLGLWIGPVPLEEIVFFWTTSLLVTQTLALFEPKPL
jgi:lycopene cyclase domain-containing protein